VELFSYILSEFAHCYCIEWLLIFFKLISCTVTLVKLLFVSRSGEVEFFRSLRYRSCCLQIEIL
jgi:hypothetical protein